MIDTFTIKRRDTSPALRFALDPASVVLTGATVRFHLRARGGAVVTDAAAVIVTATGTPTVEYQWQAADTATAGLFESEFEVTYSSGRIETFPNAGWIPVKITDDIA